MVNLDRCIREEYEKGITNIPAHSRHLLEYELRDIIDFPKHRKTAWFRAIEAARGNVSSFIDEERENDALSTDYRVEREGLRRCLSTGLW